MKTKHDRKRGKKVGRNREEFNEGENKIKMEVERASKENGD